MNKYLIVNPRLDIPETIGRVYVLNRQKDEYIHISSFSIFNKKGKILEIQDGRIDVARLTNTSFLNIQGEDPIYPGILNLNGKNYKVNIEYPIFNWETDKWQSLNLVILREISILESIFISCVKTTRSLKRKVKQNNQKLHNFFRVYFSSL